jgi:hypothetical protein
MFLDIPPSSEEFIFSYENLPESMPTVFVSATNTSYVHMKDLIDALPDLVNRSPALLAKIVNHYNMSFEFDLIEDPQEYTARIQEKISHEDVNAPFNPYVTQIIDFWIPDFSTIHTPQMQGSGILIYFAEDKTTHLPYRVELHDLLGAPQYTPLPLTPVERVASVPENPQMNNTLDYILDANDARFIGADGLVHEPNGWVHEPRYLYVGENKHYPNEESIM